MLAATTENIPCAFFTMQQSVGVSKPHSRAKADIEINQISLCISKRYLERYDLVQIELRNEPRMVTFCFLTQQKRSEQDFSGCVPRLGLDQRKKAFPKRNWKFSCLNSGSSCCSKSIRKAGNLLLLLLIKTPMKGCLLRIEQGPLVSFENASVLMYIEIQGKDAL